MEEKIMRQTIMVQGAYFNRNKIMDADKSKMLIVSVTPDWSTVMTAAEAETQFFFKFAGPGWYHKTNDSMLVIPVDRQSRAKVWWQSFTATERFRFNVYNRNPSDDFNLIINAPNRIDER